jgi:hypothetical protein
MVKGAGKIHMNKGRVGEERRGEVRKWTDVPLQWMLSTKPTT